MSDAKVSATPDDVIVTYSLGSCIGVTLYDPVERVAGILHYQLPTSTLDAGRARQNPLMFADTGMEHLLAAMASFGAQKRRLRTKLAGAARILSDATAFNIGKRNHAAIRKILWQHGLLIQAEDVGGTAPRTVRMNVNDGTVTVKSSGQTREL